MRGKTLQWDQVEKTFTVRKTWGRMDCIWANHIYMAPWTWEGLVGRCCMEPQSVALTVSPPIAAASAVSEGLCVLQGLTPCQSWLPPCGSCTRPPQAASSIPEPAANSTQAQPCRLLAPPPAGPCSCLDPWRATERNEAGVLSNLW